MQQQSEITDKQKQLLDQIIHARTNRDAWASMYEELTKELVQKKQELNLPGKISHSGYSFTFQQGRQTSKWEYSEAVKDAERDLQAQKDMEQERGVAIKTVKAGEPFWSLKSNI
tara:strand:+ start:1054 stop:1395 length:342 start_codon:yes stop_codon:yes gene_type:complete